MIKKKVLNTNWYFNHSVPGSSLSTALQSLAGHWECLGHDTLSPMVAAAELNASSWWGLCLPPWQDWAYGINAASWSSPLIDCRPGQIPFAPIWIAAMDTLKLFTEIWGFDFIIWPPPFSFLRRMFLGSVCNLLHEYRKSLCSWTYSVTLLCHVLNCQNLLCAPFQRTCKTQIRVWDRLHGIEALLLPPPPPPPPTLSSTTLSVYRTIWLVFAISKWSFSPWSVSHTLTQPCGATNCLEFGLSVLPHQQNPGLSEGVPAPICWMGCVQA